MHECKTYVNYIEVSKVIEQNERTIGKSTWKDKSNYFFKFFFGGDAIDPFKVDSVQITHTKFTNLVILFYFHC